MRPLHRTPRDGLKDPRVATILVVDDDPTVRMVVTEIVREAGHEVVEAADGVEGLETFRQREFDLVITDLEMPRKDGKALIREIKAECPGMKIVVLTAFARRALGEIWELGADRIYFKPLKLREFLAGVEELLAAG